MIKQIQSNFLRFAFLFLTLVFLHINLTAGVQQSSQDFQNFKGFWLRETIDYFNGYTAIEFYEDNGAPKAKFYGGNQNNLREISVADVNAAFDTGASFEQLLPVATPDYDIVIDTCDVVVNDSKGVTLLNTLETNGFYSRDQFTTTFTIQDCNNSCAFALTYTIFDSLADSPEQGGVISLGRFKRLNYVPAYQSRSQLTDFWDNPVNIFNYVYDTYTYMSQNERRTDGQAQQYIGNKKFAKLRDTLLTTGIVRKNKVSTEKRAGRYVGVWRTNPSNAIKTTTIRLKKQNYFCNVDKVTISGFLGAYAPLNGTHDVSYLFKGSVGPNYKDDWVKHGSEIHTVHIDYDSSQILEEYNPNIHGVAELTSFHAPVLPTTEYRELLVALSELQMALGISTHSNLYTYANGDLSRIDTYQGIVDALANDDYTYVTFNGRSRGQKCGRDLLYFNPVLSKGSRSAPIFDANDIYGLGPVVANATANSKFDHDIVIENYLETRFTVWFAVTGPVLPDEPITSQLLADYGSNGSQISFTITENGATPADLIDEYGTHPYNLYQFDEFSFFGGIVNRSYTNTKKDKCNETVAYIRIRNEENIDAYGLLFNAPLVFGRNDMPDFKYNSNEMTAFALLLEKLNTFKPSTYVLDIRENTGGQQTYPTAWGALFGGNRPSGMAKVILDFSNDPNRTLLINGSHIKSVNDSIVQNTAKGSLIDADFAKKYFPKAVVRGTNKNPKHVVVLTNVNAASGGDVFPHNFIGDEKNPEKGIHNIGKHVTAQIVGSIDGRLYASSALEVTPISNPDPYLFLSDPESQYALVPFSADTGVALHDRFAPMFNQYPWTKPSVKVPSWYEKQWQDIGVIPAIYPYPLKNKHEKPNFDDNTTWRDLALEHAITAPQLASKQ
ncbi:MAG: hypothetical protein LLF94_10065 [Chlamydiales bacterium]|nr:hypothetical protein [Chlamydiales bacterium]